jgi:hypothetical protein
LAAARLFKEDQTGAMAKRTGEEDSSLKILR